MLPFFSLTLFVSATLLFFVQPMIGKMILPRLGGTPAVWNTCMVFFQAVLLVGYGYTHALSTWQSRRWQLVVQSVVLLLPFVVLPFSLRDDQVPPAEDNPIFWLLWLLLGLVGLPFFVVATSAPLLQKWFATTGHRASKDPYFLYGASNLGSMVGLLAYPAIFEWLWPLEEQAIVWTGAYALAVGLILGCAYLVWRSPEPAGTPVPLQEPPKEPLPTAPPVSAAVAETAIAPGSPASRSRRGLRLPSPAKPEVKPGARLTTAGAPAAASWWNGVLAFWLAKDESRAARPTDEITIGRRIRWVLLAAAPSSLMLGVTTYLTTDIAAVPFFWVVPLALYLMTFILVFARWPVVWTETPHTVMLYLQPCFLLFLVLRMVAHLQINWLSAEFALHLAAFFTTALVCHGELAKDRPSARHLTEFYLWMSVGGVLGGLFNALFAPLYLPYGIVEYPIAMVAACLMRPYMAQDISQGRGLVRPRNASDVLASTFDFIMFGLGMSTYTASAKPQAERRQGFMGFCDRTFAFVRRTWPSSNILEIVLDLTIPIVFAVFAYYLLDIGHYQRKYLGITFRRSYVMAAVVVIALAMAMRPVRFGLSVGLLFLVVIAYDRSLERLVFEDRSFYGLLRVREFDYETEGHDGEKHVVRTWRTLIHGGINHGQQIVYPPEMRRQPITYFHPSNGIGEIFHKMTWGNPPDPASNRVEYEAWLEQYRKIKGTFYPGDARLPASLIGLQAVSPWAQLVATQSQPPFAVLGLGTGTLAVHAQPFQQVDFFEIDPMVKRLSVPPSGKAEDLVFYYVDDALHRGAKLDIILGDGRLKIKEAPERYYHAISLDAFSSDAIPVHLLTKEAVEEYLKHLADGGILIFNTTNRYVAIQPVLARIAEDLDLECLTCPDYQDENMPEKYGADWTVLRRKDKNLPGGVYESGGPPLGYRLDRATQPMPRWQTVEPLPGPVWTDSYSNLLRVLRL